MPSDFRPPQATLTTPAFMKSLSGTSTLQVAREALNHLPPISPTSIIHDTACGDGAITSAILEDLDASTYPQQIYASDVDANLLATLRHKADVHGWPVTTASMPMQALALPEALFSHVVINCAVFRLSDADAVAACKEMHRTLRAGGTAIVTCWAEVPHRAALQAAHEATRGKDAPALIGGLARWVDGELLRRCLAEGGFEDVRLERARAMVEVEDLEAWGREMWSVLGRTEEGWLEGDEKSCEDAIRIFQKMLGMQEGVEMLSGGRVKVKMEAWVAIVRK